MGAILYEHDDGRYAVAPSVERATFTVDEPRWHNLGPVDVSAVALQPTPELIAALATWLDGQEFHELCMDYRAAGVPQARVAFTKLREAIAGAVGRTSSAAAPSAATAQQQAVSEASNLVPGQMRCARCKFQLTRTVLYMGNGAVGAGDSKTEPCPNGCGPLWPVTWEQAARDAWATCETMFERTKAAEDALAAVNPPRLATPEPWMEQEAKYEAEMRETHAALQVDDTPLETGEGDARDQA